MKSITYEELHRLFHYDPNTGLLIRKITTGNNSKAGSIVGTPDNNGYLRVGIKKKRYKVHRVVFMMHHGYWPENEIDHINRIKYDNRIENLREVSRQCNIRNSSLRNDNKSGVKGVGWHKQRNKWVAEIRVNKKKIYLGIFTNLDSAVAARYIAEVEHNWNECETDSPAYQYLVEHGYLNNEKDTKNEID